MARKIKKALSLVKDFQAIAFRIGREEYALRLADVQEIITTPHITRVPKAPDYIRGVLNLHGNVIPVIDIAKRFSIGRTNITRGGRIVVVEVGGEIVGLAAEVVSNVTRLPQDSIKPPPPLVAGIAADYLEGVARMPGRFLIFLNLARVLETENDRTEVANDAREAKHS